MEFVVWLILLPFAGAFLLFACGAGLIAVEALSHWSVLTAGARWRLVAKLIGLACFIAPLLIMVALFVTHAAYGGSAEGGKLEQGRNFLGSHEITLRCLGQLGTGLVGTRRSRSGSAGRSALWELPSWRFWDDWSESGRIAA